MTYFITLLILCISPVCYSQQQDAMSMNGGSVLAMAGNGCVALAVDKRFGSGSQMVNIAPRHVLSPHAHLMVAFTGLEGDVQSLSQELSVQVHAKTRMLRHQGVRERIISPKAMASLTSHVLYSRRSSPFYVEPLVVGLERKPDSGEFQPYLCAQDCLGAKSKSEAFVCSGVASKSLYGTAEALWRPNLSSEELTEVCGKAFLSALERDCLSGYGAIIYIITKDGIMECDLAARND
jgi:20S proteasome subunit beta 3